MLPALIGAGASLIGGLFGQSQQNARAAENDRLQREFAQSGIQWKVEDARKAGIHPLAALGAQTHSYTPQTVGDSISPAFAAAGQDISRGIDATRSRTGRAAAVARTIEDLQLQRMGLENELLASKIAVTRQAGQAVPMPTGPDISLIEGQGDAVPAMSLRAFGDRFNAGMGAIPVNPAWTSADEISRVFGDNIGDAYGIDNWMRLMLNQTFFGKSNAILPWEALRASRNRGFEPAGVDRQKWR